MENRKFVLPFFLPIALFAVAIFTGSLLLWMDIAHQGPKVSYLDALFIATSSVCVTGLSTIDIATSFNTFGQSVMMLLMQLGGLGITTYSALFYFMLTRKVSLTDRVAVGQTLLNDPSFHLGFFLRRIVVTILGIELVAVAILYMMEPEKIGLFNAAFVSISAFCNAGFAPWSDNLMQWNRHAGVLAVVMSLIILGGIGFAVIDEMLFLLKSRFRYARLPVEERQRARPPRMTYYAKLVISTSAALVLGGGLVLLLAEYFINGEFFNNFGETVLPALFQSVTSRTAGFNTVTIHQMTDQSLLVIMLLMFIGGSSGSCAGGIKTGTFRILLGFCKATLKGHRQISVGGRGVSDQMVQKSFTLLVFAAICVLGGTFLLAATEGGFNTHGKTPFQLTDIGFEVVSAFATVGLTTGVTPELSPAGKIIVSLLMFVGRLGPIWLITALQQVQRQPAYRLPEAEFPIG